MSKTADATHDSCCSVQALLIRFAKCTVERNVHHQKLEQVKPTAIGALEVAKAAAGVIECDVLIRGDGQVEACRAIAASLIASIYATPFVNHERRVLEGEKGDLGIGPRAQQRPKDHISDARVIVVTTART